MKRPKVMTFVKKYGIKIAAVCFWLLVWEIMSRLIDLDILLASPFAVFMTLLELVKSIDFWQTIFFSFARIVLGFFLAISVGTILAIMSHRSVIIKELIRPLMIVIKSIPVASFIILALIWIKPKNLSIFASFLMVVPMIYANVGQGLAATDEKLLQMAEVFRIGQ